MNDILKKIKKHKLLFLLAILVIILLLFCLKLVLIFTESDEIALYGDRLSGIESVKIDNKSLEKKVSDKFGEHATSVDIRTQGRIANVIIKIKSDTSRDTAKDLASQSINEFSDKEKEYYDIQVFINKEAEAEDKSQFPLIGYKHHTKENINWTKDR